MGGNCCGEGDSGSNKDITSKKSKSEGGKKTPKPKPEKKWTKSTGKTKKVVVIGKASVGKTCLIKQLVGEGFDEDEKPTTSMKSYEWENLKIFDQGGEENYSNATQTFFR